MKIINYKLDIKLDQFTQDDIDVELTDQKQKSCRSWWNTTRRMEDKEIRWPIALILQRRK